MTALALVAQAIGLSLYRSPYFADDAPFFFRYAEHIAAGQGFRWNLGEDPVWGASAPLWALVLAGLARAGVAPEAAAVGAGWVLTLASTVLLALTALRSVNLAAALGCILFCATSFPLSRGAVEGMESPLAFLLVSAGLWTLRAARWPAVGLLAGFAFAQKLDFAAFGGLVLAGAWLCTGRPPWRAALLALAVAGAWYIFAYLHFGSLVPNPLVVKLELGSKLHVSSTWFVESALLEGGRFTVSALAVLGIPALWREKPLLLAAVGLIVAYVVGYTVLPPPEPFIWYRDPVQPALCFLAGCGFGAAVHTLARTSSAPRPVSATLHLLAFALVGALVFTRERAVGQGWLRYLDHFERDRVEAGRWIDAHTAPDATLLTGFGNVAFYSRRRVIDYSYLNRRPPVQSAEYLIGEFGPEVIALCPYQSGVAPNEYPVPSGYRLGATFDTTRRDGLADFYVVVMLREEAPIPAESAGRRQRRGDSTENESRPR